MIGSNNEYEGYDTISSVDGTITSESTGKRLETLETLVHAMWIMFQKNGYTNEMLDEAITEALNIEASGRVMLKGMNCPNCGRNAQRSGNFKIKCIYCGMEAVLNPYEAADIAKQAAAAIAQQEEEAAQKERWDKAVNNDPFQPYDVSKDLGFDDFN
ncbi:MAG: hypothetical protein IKN80_02870 [Clostridiales bacterium]|nr:hypothetical protein [Clostridiales bacterium]